MRHCISPHDYLVQIISNPCPSSTDLCRLGTYQSHENVTVYVGATAVTASVVVDALKPATTYKVWAVLRSYASAVQGEVRRDSTVQGIVLEYSYLAGRRTNKMVLVVKERVLALHYVFSRIGCSLLLKMLMYHGYTIHDLVLSSSLRLSAWNRRPSPTAPAAPPPAEPVELHHQHLHSLRP